MFSPQMASPRSRGSARTQRTTAPEQRGFPALAGIGPSTYGRSGKGRWLPRARGDRPAVSPGSIVTFAASPRSRGSAVAGGLVPVAAAGFPALAGIGRRPERGWSRWTRLPRARGDRPARGEDEEEGGLASPRSRGSAHGGLTTRVAADGFPALAGIGRTRAGPSSRRGGLPRARGDRPSSRRWRPSTRTASPRSRGSAPCGSLRPADDAGFPALAGIGPPSPSRRPTCSRLPRARGDRPGGAPLRRAGRRASPRSRGSAPRRAGHPLPPPGFPALAGIGLQGAFSFSITGGLPRARGDRPVKDRGPIPKGTASPRSRGSARGMADPTDVAGGFPALA